jgi:hypothetical protein
MYAQLKYLYEKRGLVHSNSGEERGEQLATDSGGTTNTLKKKKKETKVPWCAVMMTWRA